LLFLKQIPGEVKIISVNSHAHLAGRRIYTKVVRDGVDLGYLLDNKYFNFDLQRDIPIEEFTLKAVKTKELK
jgi:hypothetical protein